MSISDTTVESLRVDIGRGEPVLVDFWAPWCNPCLALMPHLERLAKDFEGRLKVVKVNTDSETGTGSRFGVRAIPTLVFFANGKELGRLTGPSTVRLRMMVEKWLGESGPASQASVSSEGQGDAPEEAAGGAETVEWRSFAGDEARKDACIVRFHEQSVNAQGNAGVEPPTTRLAGGRGQFEEIVGIPADFGELIDSIWQWRYRVNNDKEAGDEMVLKVIRAIPVGMNLARITKDILFELFFHSRWEITQYIPGDIARDIVTRIKATHIREHAGEKIPGHEWDSLQREAVMLSVNDVSADNGISQTLETLASPMSRWSASSKLALVLDHVVRDFHRFGDWSDDDSRKVDEMNVLARDQIRSEMGDMPRDDVAARDAWISTFSTRLGAALRQCRETEPDLWKRHDAWQMECARKRAFVCSDVAESMLTWLRANNPHFD
ncbi:thioredoxin [Burkholderia sp. Bp9125]|nr:thioredoxin [Burkholderia sp. Bp9125]